MRRSQTICLMAGVALLALALFAGCALAPPPTPTPVPAKPAAPAATSPASKPAAPAPSPTAVPATAAPAKPVVTVPPRIESTQPAAPGPLQTLRVAEIPALTSNAPFYVAEARGYFTKQGIKLEYSGFRNANEVMPVIASGQVDIAGPALSPGLFNAANRGISMRLVADKGVLVPGFSYLALSVRKDLADQIKDYRDLKGRSVGVTSRGSTIDWILETALRKGGLTLKDVTDVQMGTYADMNVAFANKAIDVAIQAEPALSLGAERGLSVIWKPVSEIIPGLQLGTIIFSDRFMKDRKDLGERFMVAYLQGVRGYVDAISKNKDRAEVMEVVAKKVNVSVDSLNKQILPYMNPDGYINTKNLKDMQDYFFGVNLIQGGKVDVDALIDNQFVDVAIKQLGRY